MKRFTDTDKWRDPWFRNLTSPAKQLWGYLLDNCDKIGLIEIDLALASTDCGQSINETHLAELAGRLEAGGNGKHLITKFIYFQYGTLSESCFPHRPIIQMVSAHGLITDGLQYHFSNVNETRVLTTLCSRVQDKTRQDKNGKEGEGTGRGFRKPSQEEMEPHASKLGLPPEEISKFFNHYESNGWRVGKNPMKSWQAAMNNWSKNFRSGTFSAPKPAYRSTITGNY